jgi:hypothetical protein
MIDGPGGQELMYDELRMISSADVTSNNDMVYPKVINLKLDPTGSHSARSMPIRNSMNMNS